MKESKTFPRNKSEREMYIELKKVWSKTYDEMKEIISKTPFDKIATFAWIDGVMRNFSKEKVIDEISTYVDLYLLDEGKDVSSSYLIGKKLKERVKLVSLLKTAIGFELSDSSDLFFTISKKENLVIAYSFDFSKGIYGVTKFKRFGMGVRFICTFDDFPEEKAHALKVNFRRRYKEFCDLLEPVNAPKSHKS